MERQALDLRKRNKRPINVVHWQTPFSKVDRVPHSALYYKSNEGHYLFSLNRANRPIQCWSDVQCISIIRCAFVTSNKFPILLERINPSVLYLNDGEHLNTSQYNLQVFYNKDILTILKEIEIKDDGITLSTGIGRNYNNSYTKEYILTEKRERPTLKMLRELDPTITRKEFLKLIENWH